MFGTKVNLDNTYLLEIFWSLDEVIGELRNHVRAYVRTCVRKYLRARSSNFSETWQLGKTWMPIQEWKFSKWIFELSP